MNYLNNSQCNSESIISINYSDTVIKLAPFVLIPHNSHKNMFNILQDYTQDSKIQEHSCKCNNMFNIFRSIRKTKKYEKIHASTITCSIFFDKSIRKTKKYEKIHASAITCSIFFGKSIRKTKKYENIHASAITCSIFFGKSICKTKKYEKIHASAKPCNEFMNTLTKSL